MGFQTRCCLVAKSTENTLKWPRDISIGVTWIKLHCATGKWCSNSKKSMRKIDEKDKVMGVEPRTNNGTLRKMTKQHSKGNFGWKQPIFKDLKKKGIDLICMAESFPKTQTSYSAKLLI